MTRFDQIKDSIASVVIGSFFAFAFLAVVESIGQLGHYYTHHRTWLWNDVVTTPSLISEIMTFTPYGGLMYRPNSVMPLGDAYPGHFLYTDGLALIHNGYSSPVTSNEYVIALLGGSTVEGRGQSQNNKTIAAQLESILRREVSPRVRVLNAGVCGHMSTQEEMVLQGLYAKRLHPKMVISLDGVNDANFVIAYPEWRPHWVPFFDQLTENVDLEIHTGEKVPHGYLRRKLIQYSVIAHMLNDVFIRSHPMVAANSSRPPAASAPPPQRMNMAAESLLASEESMASLAAVHHAVFFHILQPTTIEGTASIGSRERKAMAQLDVLYKGTFYWPSMAEFYRLVRIREKDNPHFHDLSLIFQNSGDDVYWDSCHYTDKGARIIATEIAKIISPSVNRSLD